jgi:putative aldouronate transport system permease protein
MSNSVISRFVYDLRRNKALLAMCIPGLVMILLFRYLPMYGIVVAFQRYSLFQGMSGSRWIGFDNFTSFFNDPYFFRNVRNTFLIGFYSIIWTFPMPILLAVLINEVRSNWFKRTTQTISYMPYFVSTVIVVGLMKTMFSVDGGIVNDVIAFFGGTPVAFFNEKSLIRSLYIGSDLWQTIGYNSIIYLAAITGIDAEQYEAARIDGASRMQSIRHITLPSIVPTVLTLLILRVGNILSVGYEKILLMYSSATYETIDVISTYVYRKGIIDQNFGYAAAVGLFNSIVSVIFLLAANTISRKAFKESLW